MRPVNVFKCLADLRGIGNSVVTSKATVQERWSNFHISWSGGSCRRRLFDEKGMEKNTKHFLLRVRRRKRVEQEGDGMEGWQHGNLLIFICMPSSIATGRKYLVKEGIEFFIKKHVNIKVDADSELIPAAPLLLFTRKTMNYAKIRLTRYTSYGIP